MSKGREKLFARKAKAVEIDGETFHLRSLTMRQALKLESLAKQDGKDSVIAAYTVACALVEDDGKTPVFDVSPDDEAALLESIADIPTSVLSALCDEVGRISYPSKGTEKN